MEHHIETYRNISKKESHKKKGNNQRKTVRDNKDRERQKERKWPAKEINKT